MVVVPFKVPSWHAPRKAEEKYGKINSGCLVMVTVYKVHKILNSFSFIFVLNSVTFLPCGGVRLFLILFSYEQTHSVRT